MMDLPYKFLFFTFSLTLISSCVNEKNLVRKQHPIALSPSFVKVKAAHQYERNAFHKIIWGKHYRDVWSTPVVVRTLDLKNVHNGLTTVSSGGGLQTTSILLKGKDGKSYTLRTIDKDPTKSLKPFGKKSFISNLLIDQTSSINPYGALIVPVLAEAINIYHTNPAIFFVPDTSTHDTSLVKVAGKMVILEEKFKGTSWKEVFPGSTQIINTDTMIYHCNKSNNYQVDGRIFAKARLLDIILNDYDRHENQWQWVQFELKEEIIFRPIPIDRDYALNRNQDGIIPWMISRRWLIWPIKAFHHNIRDLRGLSFKSKSLDKRFLIQLNEADWKLLADTIQIAINAAVIDSAIHKMPEQISAVDMERIRHTLTSRVACSNFFAEEFYQYINKKPSFYFTEEAEEIRFTTTSDNKVQVEIISLDKNEKGRIILLREFRNADFKTVNLFGFNNRQDNLIVEDQLKKKIQFKSKKN